MEHRDLTWAELVTTRRSVRTYTGEVVSRDLVRAIVEEATLAPSAFNSQPWRFLVVQGDDIDRYADVLGGNHDKVRGAGTMVAVFADLAEVTGDGARSDYYDGRTGRTPGEYGARPMIGFDADALCAVADVPSSWHPVLVLSLGWPADDGASQNSRRPVDEVLHFA